MPFNRGGSVRDGRMEGDRLMFAADPDQWIVSGQHFPLQNRLSEIWEQLEDSGGLLLALQLPGHDFFVLEDDTWKQQGRQRTTITVEGDRRVR